MAGESSFDIVSQINLQEVDNAVNQTIKEIQNRFDFKGTKTTIEFKRDEAKIHIVTDDDLRLKSLQQVLKERLAKRGISIKALKFQEPEKTFDGLLRQIVELTQGIPQVKSKEIVRHIKEAKLKVQASIQGEKVRVSSKSKDELQSVIQLVHKQHDDMALQFVNYR